MNYRTIAVVLVAGIASFLVVGIAVTAVAERWIEFSVFVGLSAGLVAGAIAAAAVSLGLGEGAPAERRRLALAFGLFDAGFLATLVVLAVAGQGVVLSTAAGVAVGIVAAVAGSLRGRKTPPAVAA